MDNTAMTVACERFKSTMQVFGKGSATIVHGKEHIQAIYHKDEPKPCYYHKGQTLLVVRR